MAKPLWDFIEKRMHELGMTSYDLETEHEIAYATVQRLKAGSTNIKDSTKQKLALALRCTTGDINAAIAGKFAEPDGHEIEIRSKNNREPSVMETVDKLEQMLKTEHPYLQDSEYDKQLKAARCEGAEEYRQKLKDIGLKALVSIPILNVSGETPFGMVGRAIMEELLKDDTGVE